MTPMIDVVFQLLIFFVLTFHVTLPEGDFNIKMPPSNNNNAQKEIPQSPIRVRLTADEQGELTEIIIDNNSAGKNFKELRARTLLAIGIAESPNENEIEVELTPDDNLKYSYVIKAMTHITGELKNGRIVKICDHVKLSRIKTKK
jgi:biopolymer transport protein ExbD